MSLQFRKWIANSFTHTSSIHDSDHRKYAKPIHPITEAV